MVPDTLVKTKPKNCCLVQNVGALIINMRKEKKLNDMIIQIPSS